MKKMIFSISALSVVLLFAARAPAQQIPYNTDLAVENLCEPNAPQPIDEQWISYNVDSAQLEKIRIELLERGFDPGFDPNSEERIDPQLMNALAEFQLQNEIPITGLPDATTLAALSIPVEENLYYENL